LIRLFSIIGSGALQNWARAARSVKSKQAIISGVSAGGSKCGTAFAKIDLKVIAGLLFTLYSGIQVLAKIQGDPQQLLASVDTALQVHDGA